MGTNPVKDYAMAVVIKNSRTPVIWGWRSHGLSASWDRSRYHCGQLGGGPAIRTRLFSRDHNCRIMSGKIPMDAHQYSGGKDPAECNHWIERCEIRRIDAGVL